MLTQKQGVFLCVLSVLKTEGISFQEGEKLTLPSDLKKKVNELVAKQIMKGEIALSEEKRSLGEEYVKEYVPGLVSNHLRRDLRLNGNVVDKPKEPGKYAGNKDPKIKNMRNAIKQLKATSADPKTIAKFEASLKVMVDEYKAKNGKVIEIDASQLDPEMKKLYESTIKAA